jgi:putative transposase
VIRLKLNQTARKCPIELRRITYKEAVSGKRYGLLSNNFKLCARTIADAYQARWQVELFFLMNKKEP